MKQFDELGKVSSIEDIILKSNFYILPFSGETNGITFTFTDLTQNFDFSLLRNRKLLIKNFQVIPYVISTSAAGVIDILFSDGTRETLPAGMRITKIPEAFGDLLGLRLIINGGPIDIFQASNSHLPLDFELDNIFKLINKPVTDLNLQGRGYVLNDFSGTTEGIAIVVLVGIYVFD
jgi:hypothetical protein